MAANGTRQRPLTLLAKTAGRYVGVFGIGAGLAGAALAKCVRCFCLIRGHRARFAVGCLISAIANATLVFLLLLARVSTQEGQQIVILSPSAEQVSDLQIVQLDIPIPELADRSNALDPVVIDTVAHAEPDLTDAASQIGSLSQRAADDHGRAPDGAGDGSGEGTGRGQSSFFQIRTDAKRIIYVVDASSSMKGRRYERACAELARSVGGLGEEQSFNVFIFSDYQRVGRFRRASFIESNARNVEGLCYWLARIKQKGGTEPAGALRQALPKEPEVIFFLTDGGFRADRVEAVIENQNRGTVIHTVAFETRDGEEALKRIAEKSGGQYRFVAAD